MSRNSDLCAFGVFGALLALASAGCSNLTTGVRSRSAAASRRHVFPQLCHSRRSASGSLARAFASDSVEIGVPAYDANDVLLFAACRASARASM
jgi:hypothetical protein